MIIARVIGQLFATQKNPKLEGGTLLLVQPLDLEDQAKGELILAVDSVGAGVGDRVLVVQEGRAANHAARTSEAPLDAAVVGIVDHINLVPSPAVAGS